MQYHRDKFIIIKYLKKFILSLEKLLVNFPRKEFLTKDMFYKDALNVLQLVYYANEIEDLNERRKVQRDILSKINMLDFYLERAYDKKYINEKQCLAKSHELDTIRRMVIKWKDYEKQP